VRVVIETPRGAIAKLKYEPELHAFALSRRLRKGLAYPYDWGFVPGTCAPDGDPLDALVLHDLATYPGVVTLCRPIGCLQVEQTEDGRKFRNDRVIFVPWETAEAGQITDIRQMPAGEKEALEHFFEAAAEGTGKSLHLLGWRGAATARREVEQAIRRREQAKHAGEGR
jgi:inorganic pyrophosphatase